MVVPKCRDFRPTDIYRAEIHCVNTEKNEKNVFYDDNCCKRESIYSRFSEKMRRMTTVEEYTGRMAKPANSFLRWNLLFTFVILLFLTFPFWVAFIPIIQVNPAKRPIKHLVGICLYKEPLELMVETLDSVARQYNAKKKISAVVGLEEGTPEREEKARNLRLRYESLFEKFMITVHPRGLVGDIPGKCSNLNYAMREAVSLLKKDEGFVVEGSFPELLVTTGDCDSIFGERYFDALEEDYCQLNDKVCQQECGRFRVISAKRLYSMAISLILHYGEETSSILRESYWNLTVRNGKIETLSSSFFMMGYLIPFNINTMSIFSLELKLLEKGEFTHPGYQMEDIIAVIRWSLAIRKKCQIRCISVATLSGPTSGESYSQELYEWARQIRRWTIGAAEVFHYFVIKSLRLPFGTAVSFACIFIFYYGFILCISTLFGLIAPIFVPLMLKAANHPVSGILIPNQKTFTFVTLSFFILQYFWFFMVFFLHSLCELTFPDRRRDNIGFFYNFIHYLMCLPTLIMYSLVELFAFLEVTIRGKSVCSHNASKKENLIKGIDNTLFFV